MGGRGGSGRSIAAPTAPSAPSAERDWWQDDEVASAVIQAYVNLFYRPHTFASPDLYPDGIGPAGEGSVAVKEIREEIAKAGHKFSRESVDTALTRIFRGGSMGTAFGLVFPSHWQRFGRVSEYRQGGFAMGGENKVFVLATRTRNFPKPRS